MPTEVLPGFLFLGSYDHASRAELLKALGIGHILNVVPTCQNLYKNSFEYYTASTSPPPLDECFLLLEKVRGEGGKVLVHCMSGMSRSPTIVVYYLMRHRGWRLSEAYKWVKDKRPAISILADDAQRLQQAEVELFGANASHFQVPVHVKGGGQQGGLQLQQQGSGPFNWPSGGSINMHATAAAPAVVFDPHQQAALNFTAGQQQHPQQQLQRLEAAQQAGASNGGAGSFVFGTQPPQQDCMLD
ncbi:hypothetical protein N2152v2_009419 [Parachlorella kessleri]